MTVYCGDCGTATTVSEGYRTCPHCGTHTRTVTGRLGRAQPRMQNIPIRTPEGRRIRDAFCLPPVIRAMDYATLEREMLKRATTFTGGVQGACLRCGNATGECEC